MSTQPILLSLSVLRAAKTDTEKFAALLSVTKLIKSNEVNEHQRAEIFNAIGWPFLQRLLHTKEVPDGCTDNIFQSIALTLLSAFSTDPALSLIELMIKEIDLFKEIISQSPKSSLDEAMINDTLQCISCIVTHEYGINHILKSKIHHILLEIYIREGNELALHILISLARYNKAETWSFDPTVFTSFMNKLAQTFDNDNSIKKFELCRTLADILLKNANCRSCSEEPWCIIVQKTLYEILRNKLCKDFRNPALELASLMMEKFSSQWFLEDFPDSKKFFCLLINLACIEIQLLLENRTINDVVNDSLVVTSCYNMLEIAISMMIEDGAWQWNESNAEQLLIIVKDTFSMIIKFLLDISNEWDSWIDSNNDKAVSIKVFEFICATFRILCCWLAEETLLLREEVHKVLPFMIKVSKYFFLLSKDENQQKFSSASYQIWNIDIMRFMIPGLCHLSVDDDARKILLAEQIHFTLLDYLQHQWQLLLSLPDAEELSVLLSTLCGIFLNIVVLERKYISENEIFFQLLKFLFNALPQLATETKYLQLKANFSVLGLLICDHYHKKVKLCETSFYKFLSSSVKFLWDAHFVENTNDTKSFILAREYKKVWYDIMELWFLGMQALSSLLSVMPWISNFLLESSWPQHIITQLSHVSESHIEANVKTAYQHFLCCVVQTYPEAVQELFNYEIVKVCKVHRLKELESLIIC